MTHLHGGFVAADSDGNPAVTPDGFGFGETQTVFYTNQPPQMPASLLWFHDHALGATRLNVFAGLAAAYILRDEFDTGDGDKINPIGIPGGAYEIPLVIQDRQFNADGTFLYPTSDIPGVTWIGEYFGDVMLVNGKVWPFLDVEPRMYRFRILNGCNARILNLDIPGATMFQIGAEGGMWDAPVQVTQLVLAPAERADVLIDFSKFKGARLPMNNHRPPKPVSNPAPPLAQVMQIRVGQERHPHVPEHDPEHPARRARRRSPGSGEDARYITLNEVAAETAALVPEPEWRALQRRGSGDRVAGGRDGGGLGLHQHDRGHPPDAHAPGHLPGGRTATVRRRRLSGGLRRSKRRSRWDRSDPVRDRADWSPTRRNAASRTRSRLTPGN